MSPTRFPTCSGSAPRFARQISRCFKMLQLAASLTEDSPKSIMRPLGCNEKCCSEGSDFTAKAAYAVVRGSIPTFKRRRVSLLSRAILLNILAIGAEGAFFGYWISRLRSWGAKAASCAMSSRVRLCQCARCL